MSDPPIYLDHNATTPVADEVTEAMWPYLTTHFGNPSSDHPHGRAAKAGVEAAREQVAALIGAHPDEIVFTSGGTESNNLAIPAGRMQVFTSAVEHPTTTEPLRLPGAASNLGRFSLRPTTVRRSTAPTRPL